MLPVLFHLGPLTLHTYGLMVAFGFLAGTAVARRTFAMNLLPALLVDKLAMLLLFGGILGARIMFFAVDDFTALAADPMSFFRIWEGGLVFYGGVVAGIITLTIYSHRTKIPFLVLTDAFVPALLVGHAFGRLGCFAAGCCYGKTSGFWPGVIFTSPNSLAPTFVALFPTQLYESVLTALLFGISYWMIRRHPPVGRVTGFYLVAYSTVRFFMEFLRGDDRGHPLFGMSPGQAVSAVSFAVGMVLLIYVERIQKKN